MLEDEGLELLERSLGDGTLHADNHVVDVGWEPKHRGALIPASPRCAVRWEYDFTTAPDDSLEVVQARAALE
jgi:hypothetical protein